MYKRQGLITWLELGGHAEVLPAAHIFSDNLTIVMCLIIGIVGCLICVYAMGYMKDYKEHHTEFKDRRSFFFAMLFVFLGAMFGLVFSNNLTWIYFFWEITSICSFLLIGYNQTEEAIKNSFKALWMNLLGGLGFAIAIVYCMLELHVADLQDVYKRQIHNLLGFPSGFSNRFIAAPLPRKSPATLWLFACKRANNAFAAYHFFAVARLRRA